MAEKKNKSATQDDLLLAALATIPVVGLVIYYSMNDASDFVKHYAKQSIALLGIILVGAVIGIIPFLGWALAVLFNIAGVVAWVVLVLQALQGKKYELPIVTEIVNNIIK
jgi:uncharacterized membrane protein